MGDGRNRKIKHPTTVVLVDAEADDVATGDTDDEDHNEDHDEKRDTHTTSMKGRAAAVTRSSSSI